MKHSYAIIDFQSKESVLSQVFRNTEVCSFSIRQNAMTFNNYSWSAKRIYSLWKAQNKRRKGQYWPSRVGKTRTVGKTDYNEFRLQWL